MSTTNPTSETTKLAQLRAKTDRQLIVLIQKTLDRGLDLARDGRQADHAYAEARRLLPLVYTLSDPHRLRLELKMRELQDRLGKPQVRTAGA